MEVVNLNDLNRWCPECLRLIMHAEDGAAVTTWGLPRAAAEGRG